MNFLLEIGTEEIPHWMIPGALAQLAKFDVLGEVLSVDATPRRLVLRATNVPERTPEDQLIVKGPPISAGEKAAAGFAKKQGVELSAMQRVGDYYELRKLVPGRRGIEILAESLAAAILGIQWPKTMYWVGGQSGGKSGPRFIRPIRWIVALLGDEVIPFEIAGVKSGNITRGHRQLGSSSIPVTIKNYESELRKNFVILSSDERRKKIESEAKTLGANIDADLLETLTFITEFPTAIRGNFDSSYLGLPAEVLTTVMKHHQKYFSVESAPGKLAPYFVAVMNSSGDPDGLVKHGNERVLRARFNDARFFWDVDQQKPLADRVEDLAKVTFHVKLGSYLEKTNRVVAIVKELNGGPDAERAALLSKADLTTEMVKEFTDLQGVVGGLYAKAQGESAAVSRAIYDHYKPLSMDDSIPETREGQIVALADKLDTLRECFRIGMVPTGSKDPFALRRAAQGVVKILAGTPIDYNFLNLFEGDLRNFMLERVEYYLRDVCGYRYDEVSAVLANPLVTLDRARVHLDKVVQLRSAPEFESLVRSYKRIDHILKQEYFAQGTPFDFLLLEPGPEMDLHDAYMALSGRGATIEEAAATLRPLLDTFFEKVMVVVPDERVRLRRLALLYNVQKAFSWLADFTKLVIAGEQK